MKINDDDYHNHHEAKKKKQELWHHSECVENGDGDFCPLELYDAWSSDTKRRFMNMKVADFYGPFGGKPGHA